MNKKVITEGPDLSAHQGQVDVKRIRDAGCRCIGLRAGYGKNNVDERYVVNAQACCNLDVDVVLYWFSYAYTVEMAEQEADYAIAQAAKYWSTCPMRLTLNMIRLTMPGNMVWLLRRDCVRI